MIRGVQGAVALRRQRSRREDMNRRMTNASVDATELRNNTTALTAAQNASGQSRSSLFGVTFFHIGLVFLFIGFLMVITAMIPGYIEESDTFDMVGTGTFFVVVGGVMTLINRAILRQEDNQLERYVSDRLSRSKSGCRLVRDDESGGFTPDTHASRHTRRPSRSPRVAEHASRDRRPSSPGHATVSPSHHGHHHHHHHRSQQDAVPETSRETDSLVGGHLPEIPEENNGSPNIREAQKPAVAVTSASVSDDRANTIANKDLTSPPAAVHTSLVARSSHVAHVHPPALCGNVRDSSSSGPTDQGRI